MLPNLLQLGVRRVVALYPAGSAISLALEVHEVSGGAVHLAGDTVPEAVEFRHFPRGPLKHLAYEFDPRGVNCLNVG